MTREEAIKRIRDFGLYHAISDLPYSTKTVEAFEMAIKALSQPEIIRCKDCSRWCICHHSDDWYCADAERRTDEQTVSE